MNSTYLDSIPQVPPTQITWESGHKPFEVARGMLVVVVVVVLVLVLVLVLKPGEEVSRFQQKCNYPSLPFLFLFLLWQLVVTVGMNASELDREQALEAAGHA